jgi:DNA-binding GntR family transcriptional regulator
MQRESQSMNEMGSKRTEGETQAQHAHRLIEEMIVTLALPPGSRISEQSLSTQLGIGRTPVREALQRLAHERTIKVMPRSGIIVADIDLAEHFKLTELRREVERILVCRAARLANPLDRRKLVSLAERFEAAATSNDVNEFISADGDFNYLLMVIADNDYAAAAMVPLQAQTRRIWYLYYRESGDVATVAALHGDLARAIADKDEKKASDALDELVNYVETYTYRTIESIEKKSSSALGSGRGKTQR